MMSSTRSEGENNKGRSGHWHSWALLGAWGMSGSLNNTSATSFVHGRDPVYVYIAIIGGGIA